MIYIGGAYNIFLPVRTGEGRVIMYFSPIFFHPKLQIFYSKDMKKETNVYYFISNLRGRCGDRGGMARVRSETRTGNLAYCGKYACVFVCVHGMKPTCSYWQHRSESQCLQLLSNEEEMLRL